MPNNTTQETFNSLLKQYYSAWFRFHPELAVHVGISGYEDQLRPFSDEKIGALISLNQKIIFSLDEINYAELTRSQQLDYTILYNASSIELHELLERDWRYLMPQKYLPLEAIHQLINRPVENLHQALKHRLLAIPEYLRVAKSFLSQQAEKIPQNWLEDAIQGASTGADYFRDLLRHPVVVSKFQNPARLQPVCDDAVHAMEDFEKFLRNDIQAKALGDFACGETHFNNLLNDWHCLDVNAEQLHRFGEKLFEQTKSELLALCKNLPAGNKPGKNKPGENKQSENKQGENKPPSNGTTSELIENQLAMIRNSHPDAKDQQILNAYRSRMKAAYNFVLKHTLVNVPEIQALKVLETPVFLRHEIPFAAYDEPSYKDPQQRGYYYVTPPRSAEDLLEHNWVSIDLTCVHEAFPGHHLQFVTANQNPENTLPRLINYSATFYEGWALYCEDLMQEQGFLDKPEHHFMMLRDRMWRALRIMLDVELHTRNLSIEAAAQRLCNELGFSIDQARADLSWYTHSPTVPMGYAVGWALIRALREEEEKKANFNLKEFHDRLLSVGSCALPLVIKYEFGEQVWQLVREKVFFQN